MSTAPPAWLPDPPRICAGIGESPITVLCSVLSLWRFAVSYLSLFHSLSLSSPQTGFCYHVHRAGTFLCDVKIASMPIGCLLWWVIRKHCSTTTVLCLLSKSNHLFSFLKKKKVCLFAFQWPYCEKKCIFVFSCKLFFKMSMGWKSRGFMCLRQPASGFDSINGSLS